MCASDEVMLLNEIADICWEIDQIEKKIDSAIQSMADIQREMLDGRFGAMGSGLSDQILMSLRQTIDNLEAAQKVLKAEHERLMQKGLEMNPLFLCTR